MENARMRNMERQGRGPDVVAVRYGQAWEEHVKRRQNE